MQEYDAQSKIEDDQGLPLISFPDYLELMIGGTLDGGFNGVVFFIIASP